MIENSQEAAELQKSFETIKEQTFATIGAVYTDGVSLIFDGTDAPTTKHYKVNTGIIFHANDRVKIAKDSGTYVVEYIVGVPMVQQTISLASNNMGYSSVTSGNYLYALNNLIGILKIKYGLIL